MASIYVITHERIMKSGATHLDAADSLAMILELGGHEVRVAHDGHAALSVAEAFRPEAALIDTGISRLNFRTIEP